MAIPPQPAHLPPYFINLVDSPFSSSSSPFSPPHSKSPPPPDSLESDSLPQDTISPSILTINHADTMYLSPSPSPSPSESDSEDSPSQPRPAGALHRRERQRQLHAQLSQKKSLEALLGNMIASRTQCSVADASKPTPSSSQSAASPPPDPTPIAIDIASPDELLAYDEDEGFYELDGFNAHQSLFTGQYVRADEACGMRRWSQLRMALGWRGAGQQQGAGVVRARVRKRIVRAKGVVRR